MIGVHLKRQNKELKSSIKLNISKNNSFNFLRNLIQLSYLYKIFTKITNLREMSKKHKEFNNKKTKKKHRNQKKLDQSLNQP